LVCVQDHFQICTPERIYPVLGNYDLAALSRHIG